MADWLTEAEAACEAATEPTWTAGRFSIGGPVSVREGFMVGHSMGASICDMNSRPGCQGQEEKDRDFIVLSRTALPRALKALRAADELAHILGLLDEKRNLGPGTPGIQKALAAYHKARS